MINILKYDYPSMLFHCLVTTHQKKQINISKIKKNTVTDCTFVHDISNEYYLR